MKVRVFYDKTFELEEFYKQDIEDHNLTSEDVARITHDQFLDDVVDIFYEDYDVCDRFNFIKIEE
jgi:hypothetical protein